MSMAWAPLRHRRRGQTSPAILTIPTGCAPWFSCRIKRRRLKRSTGFRGKSRRRPRKSAKYSVKLHRGQRRCRDVSRRPRVRERQYYCDDMVNYYQPPSPSQETTMPTRRFEQITLDQILLSGCAIVFGASMLIQHAQAQPGYVPPATPLPPPVFNPSSPYTVPQPAYRPIARFSKRHHRLIGHMHHMSLLMNRWPHSTSRPKRRHLLKRLRVQTRLDATQSFAGPSRCDDARYTPGPRR
jgi:hypothetical protein